MVDRIKSKIQEIKAGHLFYVGKERGVRIAAFNAHQNFDESDDPWIVYDTNGDSWFEDDVKAYYSEANKSAQSAGESYWVSFLVQDTENSEPWLCAVAESFLSSEEALKALNKGLSIHRVLSAWIDMFNSDNLKTTVFHECYVKGI